MGQIKFQFRTCEVGKLWGRTCLIPLGLVKLATELAGLAAWVYKKIKNFGEQHLNFGCILPGIMHFLKEFLLNYAIVFFFSRNFDCFFSSFFVKSQKFALNFETSDILA